MKKKLTNFLSEIKMMKPVSLRSTKWARLVAAVGRVLVTLSSAAMSARMILNRFKAFLATMPPWMKDPLMKILKMAVSPEPDAPDPPPGETTTTTGTPLTGSSD